MTLSVNFEIMIPFQIICQEAHSAFKSHKDRTHRKHIQFCLGQCPGTSFYEAFDINFIQVQVTGYFCQVFLIFCSGTCTKANGITEIIHRKSRHYRIKVDNTDCFSGCIIDHNVIQLGVIMRNTQWQFSLLLHITQNMCQICAVQHKLDFFFHSCCSVTYIFFHSCFELVQSVHRVMEIYDCLMKSLGRIICKQSLEMSKGNRALIKIILIFYHIITGCIFNKQINSPVLAFFIYIIRQIFSGHYNVQCLSFYISAGLLNFLLQPGSNSTDILHQFYRLCKNTLIHSLKNIMLTCIISQTICIIDMSASIRNAFCQSSLQIKCIDGVFYFLTDFHSTIPPLYYIFRSKCAPGIIL